MKTLVLASMFMMAAGAGAQAATLHEGDVAGGEFSADFRAPTVVESGIDRITGIGGAASDDYFLFTGLPSGAQDITFNFFAPEDYGYSYSAGGTLLYDDAPFAYEWAGQRLSTAIQADHHDPRQELTLSLGDAFTGSLYLALNFTHGADLRYAIFTPTNAFDGLDDANTGGGAFAPPSQVPLPPALILLGSGLLGLLYMGRVRRG